MFEFSVGLVAIPSVAKLKNASYSYRKRRIHNFDQLTAPVLVSGIHGTTKDDW